MELSTLRVSQGMRLRGEAVTRLDTFVDAAFAFVATLLVVSFDAMPGSYAELYDASRRLPAFLASFAVMAMFWHGHYRFSRRFGLEDGAVLVLSLLLVAAALFYVYPLRMVMSEAAHHLTGGWAPSEFAVSNFGEFQLIFVIYGVGFAVMAALTAGLNWRALRQAAVLRLDAAEVLVARMEIVVHLVLIVTALLSIVIALLLPADADWQRALPGVVYGLPGIVLSSYGMRVGKQIDALVKQRAAATATAPSPVEPVPAFESAGGPTEASLSAMSGTAATSPASASP